MTLISSPTQPIAVKRDEPPYDKNKSGIPVIGIMPMTIPTLIKKWMINIPKMPEAMYIPKFVLVFFMITIVRNIIIIYRLNTKMPPIKPSSSERILKIKSVDCCGRKR